MSQTGRYKVQQWHKPTATYLFLLFFIIGSSITAALQPASAFQTDTKLSNKAQEERARMLFDSVRCVVCAGQSVASSDVEIARSLRALIRTRVESGDDDEAILNYIASRYGDKVLLSPPLRTDTIILWFLPFLILCVGVIAVILQVRKQNISNR